MATLMQWGNSEGIKGRCDDKCHNAESPVCDCMCGGRYHGKRRNGTLDDAIRQHGIEIEEEARARARAEGLDISFTDNIPVEQMPLFRSILEGRVRRT